LLGSRPGPGRAAVRQLYEQTYAGADHLSRPPDATMPGDGLRPVNLASDSFNTGRCDGVTIGGMTAHASSRRGTLPPGQRRVDGFPRFGTHGSNPPPAVPPTPTIDVTGAIQTPLTVALTDLDDLPPLDQVSDFHCVAGWSATGLRWEGVSFATFYRTLVEPRLAPGTTVTHLVFRGLDGFASVVQLEDAMAEDVLIATRLDGQPLSGAHGAPIRLVSPRQYGYINTKHLCSIEVHTSEPRLEHPLSRFLLIASHPRGRVWMEERHPTYPIAVIGPIYRAIGRVGLWVIARRAR
jgi:DMSO/TMAO reductase YedYZ molybdopterin-dependent catalytic subunit